MAVPVILVVDDEALLRMLAADHFADAGFEVLEAANGALALAMLAERPDIGAVMTDVQMPGEPDGFALARHVRELCPGCAIVVVSGRAAPGPGNMARDARYLSKPYCGAEVVRIVENLLAA
ncbi:response regulator [Methylobacterium dankookense]|uniref:Response regulator receiver protein CpdR n=1 Tax=Methylobacterium dankookense TaxID=560405 RepID=A0A564FQ98_9HYPH|nr:response regulator [Methylobacterium dankookense]GJD56334.1 Response regulator receiver protein CpdR [Methylobacterium dankookense]VUF10345.1 Response regulator receiver protein CpdR [Methylobacterium dankookense]